MTPARMRRLSTDYEEIKKNFAGHKYIVVTPVGDEPPEKYHVTYFVNGIYLLPDGQIQTLGRHEVEITLHADYPRYKPICKILTPIWHPNFREGQICIGDIWGAGESLSDIIINIGDMIQYKSWNSYSPLSSEAAQWAIENKKLFPVGNINLFYADNSPTKKKKVEIDIPDEKTQPQEPQKVTEKPSQSTGGNTMEASPTVSTAASSINSQASAYSNPVSSGNDFDITAEDLVGIEFVPTAERMQSVSHGGLVKGNKVNFKTILVKGLLWALIGSFIGFAFSEITHASRSDSFMSRLLGKPYLAEYYEYSEKADEELDIIETAYEKYCKDNSLVPSDSSFSKWYSSVNSTMQAHIDTYVEYDDMAEESLYMSYMYEYNSNQTSLQKGMKKTTRLSTGLWAGVIALFIGLALGIGEGVFYGSKEKAAKYAALGAGISFVLGFISGDLAQLMYASMIKDYSSEFASSLIRGLGWAIMGLGIGAAVGLIKPEKRRILYCVLGGFVGAFLGGFVFNYIIKLVPNSVIARAVGIIFMGILIGVGVGLLEQFAKQAWLKVIRGEFEGKEYLVFSGTTSIGNNGKNTIVLFKDKLVGPHHCDIILDGSKYVIVDCGTPMGTIVNGMRTDRHILRKGDTISIGNSVLVFNTK